MKNKFNIPVIIDKLSNRNPTYRNYGRDIIEHFINDINNNDYLIKLYARFKNVPTQTGIKLRYLNKRI